MTLLIKSIRHIPPVHIIWALAALSGIGICYSLSLFSQKFGYDIAVKDMPIWPLAISLCAAGILFSGLVLLIKKTVASSRNNNCILLLIIVAGVFMRVALFDSTPVLEDDYQRYLWDGAVTAHGINPYRYSPEEFKRQGEAADKLKSISALTSPTLSRINHPELRTIYPPVTQAMFAAAYLIDPFNLKAWRIIIFAADLVTLLLIILLLRRIKRPAIWAAMYWWNPLVIKELFNSVHMEAVLIPFLIGAIYLSVLKLYRWSGLTLMLAAGVKIWPLALYPILIRPILFRPALLISVLFPAALLGLIMAWPILITTIDSNSGFVAYATKWKTNSALFPALSYGYMLLTGDPQLANTITRVSIVAILLIIIFLLFAIPASTSTSLLKKTALLISAIFLLSPAQFPWYFVWVAPFMAFYHSCGLLILTILMPLYYLAFYFLARGEYEIYQAYIIWIIWIPVWIAFYYDYLRINNNLLLFPSTGNNV
ncbi:MAG: hypothetical protein ACRBBN_04445 [Methyloligellaceae bacterium]